MALTVVTREMPTVGISQRLTPPGVGENVRLGAVHHAVVELMVAADIIEMRVARHGNQLPLGDDRHPLTQ
ncbi:hypothetical protein SAMN04487955_11910 [Halomonas korlensis]|uniref:Uncharacterized protein n=1 Tax=Halomonas korlensis TaxID=463301 RepID=A0A1I7KFB1_9GAMM|nr:hypothetical protein SAMN04487955_11910 [Halomonas korlensis]